jgi:hypothetical protein
MPETTTSSPSASWNAERSALVAEVLRRSGGLRVRGEIRGESMLPSLWPGDVVEIESCSLEDASPGEIVLALREDRLVLHRLIAFCAPRGFLLRGDSVPSSDPPYAHEALLGRLVRRTESSRGMSSSAFALHPGWAARFSRALGFLFCHVSLARRIALRIHGRLASTSDFCCSKNGAEPEAL